MRIFGSFLLIVALLFLSSCEKKEKEEIFATPKSSEQKVFKLQDIDGKYYEIEKTQNGLNFKDIQNKVVILVFWATWCPPCRAEIPHLISLQKRYQNDLSIIGVLMEDKSIDDLVMFIKEFGINYIVTVNSDNPNLAKALGARSMPFIVMYDKNGNYFTHYLGAVPEEMIERDLKKALEGKK